MTPAQPSAVDLAVDWRLDPAGLALVTVVAFLFLAGWRRRPPKPSEAAGGAAAVAALAVATLSGVATHDTSSFTAHMVQHVLLAMIVPVLLAFARPITLALTATNPATRLALRRLLRHPVIVTATRPLVGFAVFGASLVALYFTPLLEWSARSGAVHAAVHVHLLVAGTLFAFPLVGADPLPGGLAHGGRLLAVLAAVPFHAFVGVALLSRSELLVPDVYTSLSDQRLGAGILWASGEVASLILAAIVFTGWYRADQRAAARADRRDPRGREPAAGSATADRAAT